MALDQGIELTVDWYRGVLENAESPVNVTTGQIAAFEKLMTMETHNIMKCLSIVVPVYNEEANIEPLYTAVTNVLGPLSERYTWEFVFTDNGSTDATFAEIEALAAKDPRVRAYRFTKNFGFQRSILAGYCLARGDVAIQFDADLQDPPEVILDFVRLWEADYKIVFGIRGRGPNRFSSIFHGESFIVSFRG